MVKFIGLLKENFSFKKVHKDKGGFYNNPEMVGETMAKEMVDMIENVAVKYRKSKMQKWLFDEIWDENGNYDWHHFQTYYSKKDLSRLQFALKRIDKLEPVELLHQINSRSGMLKDKLIWALEYLAYTKNKKEYEANYVKSVGHYGMDDKTAKERLAKMMNRTIKKIKHKI